MTSQSSQQFYFSVIYAVDRIMNLFAIDGSLPWHVPADLKYFNRITSCVKFKPNELRPNGTVKLKPNVLICGRNTYYSKPPLSNNNRVEIVVTSHPELLSHSPLVIRLKYFRS